MYRFLVLDVGSTPTDSTKAAKIHILAAFCILSVDQKNYRMRICRKRHLDCSECLELYLLEQYLNTAHAMILT